MLNRIKDYPTKMLSAPPETLQKLAQQTVNLDIPDLEAMKEYVKRSFIGSPLVSKAEAIQICRIVLGQSPQHPFFNAALSLYENNQDDKIKLLQTAAQGDLPTDKDISAQAAHDLAQLYYTAANYKEAEAWLLKALILGSPDAENEIYGPGGFLSRYSKFMLFNVDFPDSKSAVNDDKSTLRCKLVFTQCVFIGGILSNKKFDSLANSNWFNYWKDTWQRGDDIIAANAQAQNALKLLNKKNSAVNKLANFAVWDDPARFYFYFEYCHENRIISDIVFLNLLQFMIENAPEPVHDKELKQKLIDRANYSLFKFFIKVGDWKQADDCFTRISKNFNHYVMADLDYVAEPKRSELYYLYFKKLLEKKNFNAAWLFLNSVKSFGEHYDLSVFQYLDLVEEQKNPKLVEQKSIILRNIESCLSNNVGLNGFNPTFVERFYAEKQKRDFAHIPELSSLVLGAQPPSRLGQDMPGSISDVARVVLVPIDPSSQPPPSFGLHSISQAPPPPYPYLSTAPQSAVCSYAVPISLPPTNGAKPGPVYLSNMSKPPAYKTQEVPISLPPLSSKPTVNIPSASQLPKTEDVLQILEVFFAPKKPPASPNVSTPVSTVGIDLFGLFPPVSGGGQTTVQPGVTLPATQSPGLPTPNP